jgi:hypothetical protein
LSLPIPVKCAFYALVTMMIYIFSNGPAKAFIYFRF